MRPKKDHSLCASLVITMEDMERKLPQIRDILRKSYRELGLEERI